MNDLVMAPFVILEKLIYILFNWPWVYLVAFFFWLAWYLNQVRKDLRYREETRELFKEEDPNA